MACLAVLVFCSGIYVVDDTVCGIVVQKYTCSNVCSIEFIIFNLRSFYVDKTAKYLQMGEIGDFIRVCLKHGCFFMEGNCKVLYF